MTITLLREAAEDRIVGMIAAVAFDRLYAARARFRGVEVPAEGAGTLECHPSCDITDMQGKAKPTIKRTLAEQLSATFDDSLAEIATAMDEMAAASESAVPPPPPRPLDFLLDDIERAIDGVLQERERTLASR